MRRREFITFCGGAAAWPFAAHSQQATMPIVGFLGSTSAGPWVRLVEAFRAGLNEIGFADGQNVMIEFRWAEGQYDRLPGLAAELVQRQVAVIAAVGGQPSVVAATAATSTIPIVFTLGDDPVELGIVASLNRPGGNVTGVNLFTAVMDSKRLGILHALLPTATQIVALVNPKNPNVDRRKKEIEQAGHTIGQQVRFLHASTLQDLAAAFASLKLLQADALFVGADPFFHSQRDAIVALTASHAIPAIYEQREFATAGGLISYGTDFAQSYRQAGIYAGRILKGEKPADLPVVQSTKFEFVINLKTARTLGIEVPPALSAQADEVIE